MAEPAVERRPSAAEVGAGRVLVLVYAFFVLAAGARSGVQLATKAWEAPLAYALSALAAFVYLAGAVAVALTDRWPAHARWATWLCAGELAGVVLVGAASLAFPSLFPDATVWSGFGSGYGFVPLVLPVAALGWLRWVR